MGNHRQLTSEERRFLKEARDQAVRAQMPKLRAADRIYKHLERRLHELHAESNGDAG